LVSLEDQEAFTALLQNLDEDKKRLLDQFIQVTKDKGLSEALLLSFEEATHFFEDPAVSQRTLLQDTYKWDVKRCFKGISPAYVDYSPDEPRLTLTQFLKIISMLLQVKTPETQEGKTQIPKKGTVFDRSDAKLFFEALENPDHALKPAAEQAMRVFTRAAQRVGAITSDSSSQEFNGRNIYEVVPTLRQAAEKTGVPVEEIMTIRDIQSEFGVNRTHIHDWSRRGRHGQPHLTPLPVRLKGAGGGQLLFLREEVEKKVPNPPKTGRPPK
jgi:hypothetical protein